MPVYHPFRTPFIARFSPVYHPFFAVYFLRSLSEKFERIHRLNGGNGDALGSQRSRKQGPKMDIRLSYP
jgi:hypothetical protein